MRDRCVYGKASLKIESLLSIPVPLIDFVVAEGHLLGDALYIVLGPVVLPLKLLLELNQLLEVEAIASFLA